MTNYKYLTRYCLLLVSSVCLYRQSCAHRKVVPPLKFPILKNMNKYNLDININNDIGELLDTRRVFSSMDELNAFLTDPTKMHELWDEAHKNGKEDLMLYEELDQDTSDEDYERQRDDYSEAVREDHIARDIIDRTPM